MFCGCFSQNIEKKCKSEYRRVAKCNVNCTHRVVGGPKRGAAGAGAMKGVFGRGLDLGVNVGRGDDVQK